MKAITDGFFRLLVTLIFYAEVVAAEPTDTGVLSFVYVPIVSPAKSISIERVPAILHGGRPNVFVEAMYSPVHPLSTDPGDRAQDLNALTRSGIKLRFEKSEGDVDYVLLIDLKDFKKDPELPSLENILYAVTACVRLQHPIGVIGRVDVRIVGWEDVRLKALFDGHLWTGGD